MDFELNASMMCVNHGLLESIVIELDKGKIDSFHIYNDWSLCTKI